MIILGIDPGTHRVGYGLIEKTRGSLTFIESGMLTIPSDIHRLAAIEKGLKELLKRTTPDRVGIEQLFFTKNQKTAIAVAQARGVILNTLIKYGLPLVEFTPSEVKLAVTGNGRAQKSAVAQMVFRSLGIMPQRMLDDITDALAVAITASSRRLDI